MWKFSSSLSSFVCVFMSWMTWNSNLPTWAVINFFKIYFKLRRQPSHIVRNKPHLPNFPLHPSCRPGIDTVLARTEPKAAWQSSPSFHIAGVLLSAAILEGTRPSSAPAVEPELSGVPKKKNQWVHLESAREQI